MVGLVYSIAFAIALMNLVYLVAKYKARISIYYVLMFFMVTIAIFGYMQSASARNLDAAVYANQTIYFGGCFVPFFMLMCIADLCKIRVKPAYQIFLLAFSLLMFTFVSTIGVLPWYYKSISYEQVDGVGKLVKEYGPLHILFPIYSAGAGVAGIAFIIHSFKNKKEVSHVTSTLLLIFMTIANIAYAIDQVFHTKYSVLPFGYLVTLGGTLLLLKRISMYEVTVITSNAMAETHAYGFFLCDSNGKFLGADEAAKEWFPEIETLYLDRLIENEDTDFLKQVGKWIRSEDKSEVVYLEKDDSIFEAKHSIIKECKKHNIHCVYLRDDTKQQRYTKLVQQYSETLENDVEKKTEKLRKIQGDILTSMASIVENRDSNTGGHIARTSDIVLVFVDYLQAYKNFPELTPHMAKSIIKAAPLHDFGKIAIPDTILNKPGKFTDDEYEIMKQHSSKGAVIVERILRHVDDAKFREIAINVAHYHHEKWNGQGYPEKISGEDIPFEARVMALADVFDALVSKRVYKESFGYDKAFTIIEESSGSHFDPELCKAFLECRPQLEALYNSYID